MLVKKCNYKTTSAISYRGGLTKKMFSEINNINVVKVQNYLGENNINSDFQNNKIVAWSVLKTIEIIKNFNRQYGLNIELPKNIFVKDLKEFDVLHFNKTYGFSNFIPWKLNTKKEEKMPAMSVIFNKNLPWEKINDISDWDYYIANNTATDFFLESFFHEFAHIAHEGHLLKKFGANKTLKKLLSLTSDNNIEAYRKKYGLIAKKNICDYAQKEPLDLIACDMSRKFIENIDRNSITIKNNPYKNSPYQNLFSIRNLFKKKDTLNEVINNFYNGKTNILNNNVKIFI